MHISIVTLFPEMFKAFTDYGVSGRAVKDRVLDIEYWNPRDFTDDTHRTVDDRPYGGGPGMVMMAEPLVKALRSAKAKQSRGVKTIYLSPQGKPLTQARVKELSEEKELILLCGRYEGIDERIIELEVTEQISIGDYVLSGGELPAMVLMDAVVRLLPGVLGHACSAVEDSFYHGILDHPHYTRPEEFEGISIPEVLKSGHHQNIARWRMQKALETTLSKRPELLESVELNELQKALLEEIKNTLNNAD